MQKTRKKLVGLFCLVLVAIMTVVAYFMPDVASALSDSHTDVIRVTVYDQYPAVKITSPENESVGVSEDLEVKFSYENANHVEFILSYEKIDPETGEVIVDEEGNPVYETVTLPQFDPEELDETFFYDSGDGEMVFKLGDYLAAHRDMFENNYGNFILTAKAVSAIGYAEDSIEFNYSPVDVIQTCSADGTQDPIVEVFYDDGVAMVELMPVNRNGNPLFDKPVVVKISPDDEGNFVGGSKKVTLPFGSYGLPSGDYTLIATSYSYGTEHDDEGNVVYEVDEEGNPVQEVDEDGNPVVDENGDPVYVRAYGYVEIPNQYNPFFVSYTQPAAPDVPNTGRFLETLNIAESDYVITGVIVFAGVVFLAFVILGRKKKDYRKNLRGRR